MTTIEKVYPTANNGATLPISTTRRRLTNFTATLAGFSGSLQAETQTIDVDGRTTTIQTFVDRSGKTTKVVATTTGIANSRIETFTNSLPTAVKTFDGLSYGTGYDALYRPASSTDPRTGSAYTYYKTGSAFGDRVSAPVNSRGEDKKEKTKKGQV